MYETTDKEGVPDGALIVNLNTQWLFNNIRQINMIDDKKQNSIFVFDEQGNLIESTMADKSITISLKGLFSEYKKNKFSFTDNRGFITKRIGRENYILTFLYVDSANLILVKVQLYNEVFNFIKRMRVDLIMATLIFLVLGVIISISISRRIYKPIDSLVRQVSSRLLKKVGTETEDEFSYLNEIYRISGNKIENYEKERIANRDILKSFYLRKLLTEASPVQEPEFSNTFKENNISLNIDRGFALCVMPVRNCVTAGYVCRVHRKDIQGKQAAGHY